MNYENLHWFELLFLWWRIGSSMSWAFYRRRKKDLKWFGLAHTSICLVWQTRAIDHPTADVLPNTNWIFSFDSQCTFIRNSTECNYRIVFDVIANTPKLSTRNKNRYNTLCNITTFWKKPFILKNLLSIQFYFCHFFFSIVTHFVSTLNK